MPFVAQKQALFHVIDKCPPLLYKTVDLLRPANFKYLTGSVLRQRFKLRIAGRSVLTS